MVSETQWTFDPVIIIVLDPDFLSSALVLLQCAKPQSSHIYKHADIVFDKINIQMKVPY